MRDVLEQERADFDQRYATIDPAASTPENPFPPAERELWHHNVGDLEGKTVLDCGAGDGVFSLWLAQQGATVLSVELSPVGCEKIRESARIHQLDSRVTVLCADLCDLDSQLPADSFDLVLGLRVLHHLPALPFGQALHHVLKPQGVALFCENSAKNPLYRLLRAIRNNESPSGAPLTQQKVKVFIDAIGRGECIYPRFALFGLMKNYVFRANPTFARLVDGSDRLIDGIPGTRRWSASMWVRARKN